MRRYKYLSLVLAIIILITFYVSWTVIVLHETTQKMDTHVLNFMVENRGEKGNFLYYFNRIITEVGNTYVIIVVLLVLLILFRGNLVTIGVSVGVGLAAIFNESIKNAYGRERPLEMYRWMVEKSNSYPSGHSNMATILYGSIIYVILKSNLNKKTKVIIIPFVVIIPLLVYTSRLILSVHWASDVIGGIINGLMFLSITILACELIGDKTSFDGLKPIIDNKLKNEVNNEEKGETL